MGFTFKILLNKRRTKTDLYPVIIRIYLAGYYKELSIGVKLPEAHWDDAGGVVSPSNPNHKIYNAKILNAKNRIQKILLLADIEPEKFQSLDDIIEFVKTEKPRSRQSHPSFTEYAALQVKQLESTGKAGNSLVYSCALNKLKEYIGEGKNLQFEQLTFKFLTEFTNSMLNNGIKINSISVYMRTLRAIFNKAIKENIVPAACYPFNAYRIKNEKTISRTLTLAEMRDIVRLELPEHSPTFKWRNYFLISFCLIGINFADLLTLTSDSIKDDRILFRRRKTGKIYSIKLHHATITLIKQINPGFSKGEHKLLFPVLKRSDNPMQLKKDIWQAIKSCNTHINKVAGQCNISKDVTTYYARYTWANIAKVLGYSKDMIAEALGHQYGNAVTGIYLDNYDNEIIDEMNSKVIDAVFTN